MLTALPRWDVTGRDALTCTLDLRCPPGGGAPQCIGHPGREQRFHVRDGAMLLEVDGAIRVVRAGQQACVPAGARHRWAVHGPTTLRCEVEVSPG